MTSLIWELPESLKLMAIQLQGKLQALVPLKRVIAALRGTTPPPAQDTLAQEGKVWAWGDVAQELINLGQKYSPVETRIDEPETCVVRHTWHSPRL